MTTTKSKTTTKKTKEEKTPVISTPPHLPDPFLPIGYTNEDNGFTASYAGVITGMTYLKTVTAYKGLQSESLLKLEGDPQIVPSNVEGFYKVI